MSTIETNRTMGESGQAQTGSMSGDAGSCMTAVRAELASMRERGCTWGKILAAGQQFLQEAGIAEYSLDAWYLFERAFGISRMQYLMCSASKAEPEAAAAAWYEESLVRRAKREPLQHILGVQEFMGLEFLVNRHTLIPRQDTETLVELVLQGHKERDIRLLDMCTGSGCIAISLKVLGGYAHVEAADISEEALQVARQNAKKLVGGNPSADSETLEIPMKQNEAPTDRLDTERGMNAGVAFRHSDLFSAFDPTADRFDIIVSNPPYIPSAVIEELEPEVRDFEPRGALDGTADGLFFYEKLAAECGRFLKENGAVYFEIGHDQGEAVEALLRAHGFTDTRVVKDLAGKDRVVCGRWQTA